MAFFQKAHVFAQTNGQITHTVKNFLMRQPDIITSKANGSVLQYILNV
jgi:hypothetical protein